MSKVSVLGLGAMGSRMAKALIRAGHQVTVWNRSPEPREALRAESVRFASSPREAACEAEFVIAMVRDDEASRAVWLDAENGALAAMRHGAIAIESSTLLPAFVRELARSASERPGVSFLDAPVAGSRPQADAGQLIYLVGGDAKDVARAKDLLGAMGAAVHHAGPVGAGMAVKLATNALFAVQVAALAELLAALARAGIDVDRAVDIVGAMPVCSPAAKSAAVSMREKSFAPMFPAELAEKDLGYFLGLAESADSTVPLAAAARAVLATAVARGFGADHLTGVIRLYPKAPRT